MDTHSDDDFLSYVRKLESEVEEVRSDYERLKERSRYSYEQRRKSAFLALSMAILGLIGSLSGFFALSNRAKDAAQQDQHKTYVDSNEFRYAIAAAYNRGKKDARVNQTPPSSSEQQMRDLNARVAAIESSIGGKADIVLSVPLIRKDVEAANARIESTKDAIGTQISQIYTLLYFILSLITTVIITIIGAAIAQLFKKKPVLDGGGA